MNAQQLEDRKIRAVLRIMTEEYEECDSIMDAFAAAKRAERRIDQEMIDIEEENQD